jgi:peroxiredoxin
MEVPAVRLPFVLEAMVSLAELARRHSLAVFLYAGLTSQGDGEQEDVEVGIEMARAWGWREHGAELEGLGYRVVGVSTQSPEVQLQFASDELLDYTLLSDIELLLADALRLPTRWVAGEWVYEPLTMVVQRGRIVRVFHPVEDLAGDAANITGWIRRVHA